jgi:hypothetical protein
LKIETRAGTIFYDSSWIAGVIYNLTSENEENEENTENGEENEEKNDIDAMDPNEIVEILQENPYKTSVE